MSPTVRTRSSATPGRAKLEGEPHAAVALEQGIGDLDQEEDVAGRGVSAGVEITAGPHNGQVQLRLGHRLQGDGLLLPNQRATAEARAQQLAETSPSIMRWYSRMLNRRGASSHG